jgi:DNA processing protein
MSKSSTARNLLIALNVGLHTTAGAVQRLSATPGDWLGLTSRSSEARIIRQARSLAVAPRTLRAALELVPDADRIAEREIAACGEDDVSILTIDDGSYPASLRDLEHPPPVLYLSGALPRGRVAISIVGSRRSDQYGLEVAESLALELAGEGITIVSGLAVGVDAAAHRGALRAGGHTIAVLGCGIDVDYPRANRHLARDIRSAGAIVSEFPRGSAPEAWRFPIRNRIIAALAFGTVVVRATPRSGSLITAHRALELGRHVYAVPGNIFDHRSVGPNSLVRDGAFPVQHSRDIIETLPSAIRPTTSEARSESGKPSLDHRLRAILDLIRAGEGTTEDEIVRSSSLRPENTLAALSELEIKGYVRRLAGASFARTPGTRVREDG